MKKLIYFLLGAILLLSACNDSGVKRNDIVSAQIDGKLKECYCRVQFVKANGIIQIHCQNDSLYLATRLQVVKCEKQFNYRDWFPVN